MILVHYLSTWEIPLYLMGSLHPFAAPRAHARGGLSRRSRYTLVSQLKGCEVIAGSLQDLHAEDRVRYEFIYKFPSDTHMINLNVVVRVPLQVLLPSLTYAALNDISKHYGYNLQREYGQVVILSGCDNVGVQRMPETPHWFSPILKSARRVCLPKKMTTAVTPSRLHALFLLHLLLFVHRLSLYEADVLR